MTTGQEFERRVAFDLHAELDGAVGPHREWMTSPAAARVADRRGQLRWPLRLLAVAAVVAVAGGLAMVIGSRPAVLAGCPTLADYAAASAAPTPALGEAPGVSFPPVAPDASPTTGLLQQGTWAVISDDKGPLGQMRLRDVRDCGRLPDVRSGVVGGTLILATADVRILRDDPTLAWVGASGAFDFGLGGADSGQSLVAPIGGPVVSGIPGVDGRSKVPVGAGFTNSSTVIVDVWPTDLEVDAFASILDNRIGASASQQAGPQPGGVGWILRPGRTGVAASATPPPTPGASDTTGEQAPGTYATITDPAGDLVLQVTDVDQVEGYLGRMPSPGDVFVEARLRVPVAAPDGGVVIGTWRAVDSVGHELAILANADPNSPDPGVLQRLNGTTLIDYTSPGAWLVVEAPRTGLVRLELTRSGETQPLLSYVLRRP